MKFFNKQAGLNKTANKLVKQLDQFEKLKEIANRKNYPYRVKILYNKIQQEYGLWSRKGPSAKLLDLKKDLIFIEAQLNGASLNKEKIDLLTDKYG